MKQYILAICSIACIALAGCGDVSYQYEGGAGTTSSTNLPQEEYCDQGIAPGTVRCTDNGTKGKVEICIGTKWVQNDNIWCDEGCDGNGNCKKPTAEEPVPGTNCSCENGHIKCEDVEIKLGDHPVACNSNVKCDYSKLQMQCEQTENSHILKMECSEYIEGNIEGGSFAEINCPWGCDDGKCRECPDGNCNQYECEDDKQCVENDRPFCNQEVHRCVQCLRPDDCIGDGDNSYSCVSNMCTPIADECKDVDSNVCEDGKQKICTNGQKK